MQHFVENTRRVGFIVPSLHEPELDSNLVGRFLRPIANFPLRRDELRIRLGDPCMGLCPLVKKQLPGVTPLPIRK